MISNKAALKSQNIYLRLILQYTNCLRLIMQGSYNWMTDYSSIVALLKQIQISTSPPPKEKDNA